MKKFLIYFAFLIGILSIPYLTFAELLFEQPDEATLSTFSAGTWVQTIYNTAASDWTVGSFDSIKIKIDPQGSTPTIRFTLRDATPYGCTNYENDYSEAGGSDTPAGYTFADVNTVGDGAQYITFSTSTLVTLNPAKCYRFQFSRVGGDEFKMLGSTNNPMVGYARNIGCSSSGDCEMASGSGIDDIFIQLADDNDFSPGPGIDWNTLTDGGTFSDFNYWDLNLTSVNQNDYVSVVYSPLVGGESSEETYVDTKTWRIPLAVSPFLVPKSEPLWHPPYLQNVEWEAVAYLFDSSGNTLAFTDVIDFTINGSAPATTLPGSSTLYYYSTSTENFVYDNVDCTITTGWLGTPTLEGWECLFRKVGAWLGQLFFVPTDTSLSFISDTFSDFKTIFPFSLFFTINNEFQNQSQYTSSSLTSLSFQYDPLEYTPVGDLTSNYGATETITILNSSTLVDVVGASTANAWFNFLITMFGLYVIYKIYRRLHPKT